MRSFWKPLYPSCPSSPGGFLPGALGCSTGEMDQSCNSPSPTHPPAARKRPEPSPQPAPRPHLLNMGRNVFLYVVFFQSLSSTLHRVLLHLLRHIGIFDHGLSVAHGYLGGEAGARDGELGCGQRLRDASCTCPLRPPPTVFLRRRRPRRPNGGSTEGNEVRQRSPAPRCSHVPHRWSRSWPTAIVSWGRG